MGIPETEGPRVTPESNHAITLPSQTNHCLILKNNQQIAHMEPTSPRAPIKATPIALLVPGFMKFGFADFLL